MPTFLPISPVIKKLPSAPKVQRIVRFPSLQFYLDVDPGGDIELAQRVDGLLGRFQNVEQPLVRANLELVARFLVDVRRTVHGESFDARGQGNRACHSSAGASHGLDDLTHRLIQDAVVVGLEPNPYLLIHTSSSDLPSYLAMIPSATAAGTGS